MPRIIVVIRRAQRTACQTKGLPNTSNDLKIFEGRAPDPQRLGGPYAGRTPVKRSRSPLGGLQTPTGTIDRDFGAFREASRHRQARQIVTCEPPRHRQGRWIVTWGASRGSLEASGTPTGPMDLDFASSESLQEPPRSSKRSLWSSRTRQEAIRQPTWSFLGDLGHRQGR